MNKKDAARFLNVSEKTIERWKAAGKLPARLARVIGPDGKSRVVLDFKETDLRRLAEKLSGETVFPTVMDRPETDGQTDGQSKIAEKSSILAQPPTDIARLFQVMFGQLGTTLTTQPESVRRAENSFLTDDEAAEYTGLTPTRLKRARDAGKLKFVKDRGIKYRRADLDRFLDDYDDYDD